LCSWPLAESKSSGWLSLMDGAFCCLLTVEWDDMVEIMGPLFCDSRSKRALKFASVVACLSINCKIELWKSCLSLLNFPSRVITLESVSITPEISCPWERLMDFKADIMSTLVGGYEMSICL
jgi:hypothetical protein